MEAISQAGSAVGLKATNGVVLVAEKRITSKLLDKRKTTEKMYKIDDHVSVAVAGITSDANILLNYARLEAQKYLAQYGEPIPIEQLLQRVCDLKQGYTQYGGLRPFGVSFLFAGWDEHFGFQLFQSDPSGNYGGWKARAIGANHQAAQTVLKEEYDEEKGIEMKDALMLAIKVMSKTMDTTVPTPEKLEISTLTRNAAGEVEYHILSQTELEKLLGEYKEKREQEMKEKGETDEAEGDI